MADAAVKLSETHWRLICHSLIAMRGKIAAHDANEDWRLKHAHFFVEKEIDVVLDAISAQAGVKVDG